MSSQIYGFILRLHFSLNQTRCSLLVVRDSNVTQTICTHMQNLEVGGQALQPAEVHAPYWTRGRPARRTYHVRRVPTRKPAPDHNDIVAGPCGALILLPPAALYPYARWFSQFDPPVCESLSQSGAGHACAAMTS